MNIDRGDLVRLDRDVRYGAWRVGGSEAEMRTFPAGTVAVVNDISGIGLGLITGDGWRFTVSAGAVSPVFAEEES